MTVGERMKQIRKEKGLTQKQLGERANIAEPTIRRYELGKLNPKFETIRKIADALEVSVYTLIEDFPGDLRGSTHETGMRHTPTKHTQHEASEQAALFRWAELIRGRYPEIDLLYHIPNGGSRNAIEAANLKRQGVKAGVPDLCLPVARGPYHGLYIELKHGKNQATERQQQWLSALRDQGYLAEVCYGRQQAEQLIEKYLKLKASKT